MTTRELWAGVAPVICNSRKLHDFLLAYQLSMLGLHRILEILLEINGKETALPFI